jgi:hypothetical protein
MISTMPVKGKVPRGLLGKLVWWPAAAISEFLTTLPSEVGTQRMMNRLNWMPVAGDCVVSGQIFGPAKVGRLPGFFSFVSAFRFWNSNSKRKLEKRKQRPANKPPASLTFQ